MNKRGFTLIELLVVIAIIAIISVVGIAAYSTTQAAARDSNRQVTITQLAKAIELTKDGSTGVYKYTDADYTADFGRSAGGALYADPTGFSTRYIYCVKTATSVGTTWTPTVDTTWTSSACPSTATNTLTTSLAASGCAANRLCNNDVKSWVICARLERTNTAYCISSAQ